MEREIFLWWLRSQWVVARRGLDRAMRAWERGNPFAEEVAGMYGERLRWCESARDGEGMDAFRAAGVKESVYRQWLCRHLRRYAARLDFAALVLGDR